MTQKWTRDEYRKYLSGAMQNGTAKRNKREEGNLSSAIEQWLRINGFENDRINSGSVVVTKKYTSKKTGKTTEYTHLVKLAKAGTPDRWVLYRGRWILIETKLKGGKPSEVQQKRQRELAAAGALIINADSFEIFENQFREFRNRIDEGLI